MHAPKPERGTLRIQREGQLANGRNPRKKDTSGRDSGPFFILPWSVMDCPAYANLSHPARCLLFEFMRQFVKDNNGRLLASTAYLRKRHWKSADVITRAKRELMAAGFIFQTVMGHRPNKASWYAVTWLPLDKIKGYDEGATQLFKRSAYTAGVIFKPKSSHEELFEKHRKTVDKKILIPSHGVVAPLIVPSSGIEVSLFIPPSGAIGPISAHSATPPHGNHLEMPSTAAKSNPTEDNESVNNTECRDSFKEEFSH